jgi:hypothetical protein
VSSPNACASNTRGRSPIVGAAGEGRVNRVLQALLLLGRQQQVGLHHLQHPLQPVVLLRLKLTRRVGFQRVQRPKQQSMQQTPRLGFLVCLGLFTRRRAEADLLSCRGDPTLPDLRQQVRTPKAVPKPRTPRLRCNRLCGHPFSRTHVVHCIRHSKRSRARSHPQRPPGHPGRRACCSTGGESMRQWRTLYQS